MHGASRKNEVGDREKLLDHAILCLQLSTAKDRKEAQRRIREMEELYNFFQLVPDDELIKIQLQKLQNHLSEATRILTNLNPLVLVPLLGLKGPIEELIIPEDWDPERDPHPLNVLLSQNLTGPLSALADRCSFLLEHSPPRVRSRDQTRMKALVYHSLLLFATMQPGKARPYARESDCRAFLLAVYSYVTGDTKHELRRQIDKAFDDLRAKHPELLPENLQTPVKRKS